MYTYTAIWARSQGAGVLGLLKHPLIDGRPGQQQKATSDISNVLCE